MAIQETPRDDVGEVNNEHEDRREENTGNQGANPDATKTTGKTNRGKRSKPAADVSIAQQSKRLAALSLSVACETVQIRKLSKCQIRSKIVDPATVELYKERLSVSEPPYIILIKDEKERLYIADGHHRVAAAVQAGRTTITAVIYRGTRQDARIVGLELNRGSLPLSLAERKALLEELLDTPDLDYSVEELAATTGLHQATVEKRKQEREEGDFLSDVSGIKRSKSPEEKFEDAVKAVIGAAKKAGSNAVVKAVNSLPTHTREEIVSGLNPVNES